MKLDELAIFTLAAMLSFATGSFLIKERRKVK